MDIGIDLLANPQKIKKKKYLIKKRESDFDIRNFIYDSIVEELDIDLKKHPKNLIENIIEMSLKIVNEDKSINIPDIKELDLEEKKIQVSKIPNITKKLKVSNCATDKKDPIVEVKKLPVP